MSTIVTRQMDAPDLAWLAEVREERSQLSEQCPVWVRHGVIRSGSCMPSPQRHPFCELAMLTGGRGMQCVEVEQAEIRAGDVFLCGPGVPHYHRIVEYPHRFITAYFLPSVFIGPGLGSDGLRILRRVMARQPLAQRIVRPSISLRRGLEERLSRMAREVEGKAFGWQLTLQSILFDLLVELIRWEQKSIEDVGAGQPPIDWQPLDSAIRFIGANFKEAMYSKHVAEAAGLSESALKQLFRDALGMTWVRYMQGYRVNHAAALLSVPGCNVTEAALACGFESLSHFNSIFKKMMGVSPTTYAKGFREPTGKM